MPKNTTSTELKTFTPENAVSNIEKVTKKRSSKTTTSTAQHSVNDATQPPQVTANITTTVVENSTESATTSHVEAKKTRTTSPSAKKPLKRATAPPDQMSAESQSGLSSVENKTNNNNAPENISPTTPATHVQARIDTDVVSPVIIEPSANNIEDNAIPQEAVTVIPIESEVITVTPSPQRSFSPDEVETERESNETDKRDKRGRFDRGERFERNGQMGNDNHSSGGNFRDRDRGDRDRDRDRDRNRNDRDRNRNDRDRDRNRNDRDRDRIDREHNFERSERPDRERDENAPASVPPAPRPRKFFDMALLNNETLPELRERANNMGVQNYARLKKDDLIVALLRAQAEKQGLEYRGGVLDILDDNMGFLRAEHYLPGPEDIYVSPSQIRRFGLRTGDMVFGQVRSPKDSEKFHSLLRVESVNGQDPEQAKDRPHFDKLTPIFPNKLFDLEQAGPKLSTRLMNLIAPIGRGQRGLIVAPPKVGKTTILKEIANAISTVYRDVHLMIALIAERPEEATDMDRSVDAEVVASTFDEPVQNHVRVAEMVLARAKRLVECGRDVVILLDSLTRLSRAYNLTVQSSGRTLSGGIDPAAMYPPKEFFGAARNIEEGGSLTIIATVLVDTNSRMDEVIFEEFKGTGNMELHLSRRLAERRVFPAIDIDKSGTRREDLLLGEKPAQRTYLMRRMFGQLIAPQPQGAGYELTQAMEAFLNRFNRTKSNDEFLQSLVS
jgi:transcription termination factor Rho